MVTGIPFGVNVVAQAHGRKLLCAQSMPGRVREARTAESTSDICPGSFPPRSETNLFKNNTISIP